MPTQPPFILQISILKNSAPYSRDFSRELDAAVPPIIYILSFQRNFGTVRRHVYSYGSEEVHSVRGGSRQETPEIIGAAMLGTYGVCQARRNPLPLGMGNVIF